MNSDNASLSISNGTPGNSCDLANQLLSTAWFPVLLALQLVLGLQAVLGNLVMLVCVCKAGVFHLNLRLLLANISLCLCCYSTGYLVKAVGWSALYWRPTSPCRVPVTTYLDCQKREAATALFVQMPIYAELALCVERLLSTACYRSYDRSSGTVAFGLFMLPLSYAVPLVFAVAGVTPPTVVAQEKLQICENLLALKPFGAVLVLGVNALAMCVCVLCVVLVHRKNVRKLRDMVANRAQHSLAARFQIDQNIKINRVLIPDIVLQLVCYLPNYALLFVTLFSVGHTSLTQTLLVHFNYVWKLSYAVAHPLLAVRRNVHLRLQLRRLLPFSCCRRLLADRAVAADGPVPTKNGHNLAISEQHFRMLQESWNSKLRESGAFPRLSFISALPSR